MKQQFLFSMKALVKSKKFYNCIVLAIVIAFIFEFLMFRDAKYLDKIGSPNHAFFFISSDHNNLFNMFLIMIPLFSILPYGDTYYKEKEFINQIFTRTSKSKYLIVNSCMAFITGFIFIFIFLGFMYFFNYLLLKTEIDNPFYYMVIPFVENDISTISIYPFLTSVLFDHPTLFNWIYIVIISFYAGLLSVTTYSISLWVKSKIIAYITPFAITMLTIPISLFLPSEFLKWMPYIVFSPRSGMVAYHELAIVFWTLLFLTIIIVLILSKYRKDVLE